MGNKSQMHPIRSYNMLFALRENRPLIAFPLMKNTRQPLRVAIIYPKAIGDFMFVLPALHTLRQALPDADITLVVKRKQAPLALPQKGRLVDDVLVLGSGNSWYRVRRALAQRKIDTMLDLVGNDQSGLLMALRGGRRIRPDSENCKGKAALYSAFATAMPPLPLGHHRVDELLRYVSFLQEHDPVYSFRLTLPPEAVDACEEMIAAHDLRSGKVVVLNIGASRDTKRWPAHHFRTLAQELISAGYRVVFTGARTFRSDDDYDRKMAEQFLQDGLVDGEKCIDCITGHPVAPDLQLQRDAYFLRYSGVPAVVVGNDTGPMQIAGSVGEDARNHCVSLFGPTNWGRYAPYDPTRHYPEKPAGDWNHVLCSSCVCIPKGHQEACKCYRRGCGHKQCMSLLAPEKVLEAVVAKVPLV